MLIPRLDLIHATLTMSAPRFPYVGDEIPPDDSEFITSDLPHTASPTLERLPGPLPAILREIRLLMAIQDGFSTGKILKDLVLFGKKRSLIFHRLLSSSVKPDSSEDDFALFEPCRIAAIIFVEYILSTRRPRRDIMQALESRLRSSLQSLCGWDDQRARPWDVDLLCEKIILWVHFMGGLASSNTVNSHWYEERISHSVVSLGLKNWKEFRACLSGIVMWGQNTHDLASEALWQRVQSGIEPTGG